MSDVYVYIYDLSKGLARQLSLQVLGKQIDGIWHTGIVVFGKEIFFGSSGIEFIQPEGTLLGAPQIKFNVGLTYKTKNELDSHLKYLSNTDFHFSTYKLLYNNCNTFSNQLAIWLTGKGIPDYVINLPKEVLSTQFGSFIQPYVDKYSPVVSAAYVAAATSYNDLKVTKLTPVFFKEPLGFHVTEFLKESSSLLDSKNYNLLMELIDCVTTNQKQFIISDGLNDMIMMSIFSDTIDIKTKLIVFDVLRLLIIKNEVALSQLINIFSVLVEGFVKNTENNDLENMKCKLICNLVGMMSDEQVSSSILILINKYALEILRSRSNDIVASSMIKNVIFHRYNLDIDTCLESASALIYLASENNFSDDKSEKNVVESIYFLIQDYAEIKDLAISFDILQKINTKMSSRNL